MNDRAALVSEALGRHERTLVRYAERLLGGDLERAREVVQDTFLRLWQADADAVEGHLAEWLFTVCRNRALDVSKHLRRAPLTPTPARMDASEEIRMEPTVMLSDTGGESPEAAVSERQTSRAVLTALDALPHEQQEVVRLRFQGGLSYREISRVTRLPEGTVGYLLHIGMRALRRQLAEHAPVGQGRAS